MRWIVLSLLLINVAFAGWYAVQSSAAEELPSESVLPELALNNLRMKEAATDQTPSQPAPVPEEAQCAFIGGFARAEVAEEVQAQLQGQDVPSGIVTVDVPDEPLWWVHLAPASSRNEADRMLRSLSERQIDSFLVTQGEYRLAISLGYFRDRANAVRLRERMEARDVAALLQEMQRFRQDYWLVAQPGSAEHLTENLLRPVRDQVPDVSVRREACDWLQNS